MIPRLRVKAAIFEDARAAYDVGDYAKAKTDLQPLLNDPERGPLAHYLTGHVHRAAGEWPQAKQEFECVIVSGSLLTQLAHWNLALVLLEQGDAAGAAVHLKAVETEGGDLAKKAVDLRATIE